MSGEPRTSRSRVAARIASWPRGLARTLSGQLALLACAAAAPVLAGLVVLAVLMVVSDHAVVLTAAIVGGSALLALGLALVFARAVAADLEAIGDGLEAVGAGQRDVEIVTSATDELARVAQAANAMVARLDAEESSRRHLLAAISHDLRTPLTSLRLLADAVGDELVDGAQRRAYVDRIAGHVDALGTLIDDLFELSRLEARDVEWTFGRVVLADLVLDTVEVMRAQAEEASVALRADVPAGLELARANPEKLQRVLFNLLHNAIRHTPAGGRVEIVAASDGDAVEVEVSDTGDGIDPERRERVFEPFHRGDDAARTGIGLAIARAIVEAHGGRIWVADAPVGARVRFRLPAGATTPAPSAPARGTVEVSNLVTPRA